MVAKQAKLTIDGKTFDLPILESQIGPDVIDISKLYSQTDYLTYDPGFMSTASCASTITYIDGDNGILLYRGHDVKKLALERSFLEVAYLLLYEKLPNDIEKKNFNARINKHSMVNEQLKKLIMAFPSSAHPMSVMLCAVGYLASLYPEAANVHDPSVRDLTAIRVIAKISTLTAMIHKYHIGQPFNYPDNSLDFINNFLQMMFRVPSEKYDLNPVVHKAIEQVFILHLDHEQNASTSTVRAVGSTDANPFACISAGISALWGPAHGGANEAVISMLSSIKDVRNVKDYISKVKNKEVKLMGFGHRVYKSYDPRAAVLKDRCQDILASLGYKNDPLLEVAKELENIALNDEYFIERKLYPNVDFYSGLIYKAVGIPATMFTPMFVLARTVGWISQWKEMHEDKSQKIYRPRQLYIGQKSA